MTKLLLRHLRTTAAATMITIIVLTACPEEKDIDSQPQTSTVIKDFDYPQLLAEMSEMPLHHIERVWLFPATGIK